MAHFPNPSPMIWPKIGNPGTVALNISYKGLLLMELLINEKQNQIFITRVAKIDTLFMATMAAKPYSLELHIPI